MRTDPIRRLAEAIVDSLFRSGEETADYVILRKGTKDVGRLGRVPATEWITATIQRDAREANWTQHVQASASLLTPTLRRALAQMLAFEIASKPTFARDVRDAENQWADRLVAGIDGFLDVYAPEEDGGPEAPRRPDEAEAPAPAGKQKKGGPR